ncbi:hypothetical protein PCANC_01365 [Puccinia coronata f. sp. avenae]|uniref:Uncharacterized protein n=1 Tax=Puccinia coronata f. sp. avenae TaxID=200324 RepID=A0A2N5W655_9BASI|nr:hypothetical protein PCANC_01365 [Puccinia coronata f. sp. avenae]
MANTGTTSAKPLHTSPHKTCGHSACSSIPSLWPFFINASAGTNLLISFLGLSWAVSRTMGPMRNGGFGGGVELVGGDRGGADQQEVCVEGVHDGEEPHGLLHAIQDQHTGLNHVS